MTAPHLIWGPRPRDLACPCGRTPLCGFTSADGKTFHCAACFTDGVCEKGNGVDAPPRFRTPKERASILRGIR